jgi:gamma-glutamyltranspeptidase/glutathione hydrolase
MEFDSFSFPSRRSNILAMNGMAATSQPLAAQAGIEILQAGGNAIDAAIATAAVLCVTEPCSTGIGGDAFALIWSADQGKLFGLNASGPAPAALTATAIMDRGWDHMPERGPLSITVPGSVKGWGAVVDRFGSMTLETILRRAIHYAEQGFPVSQKIARAWAASEELLASHPDSRRAWLPDGRAPQAGAIFKNPALGRTLQILARDGADSFYHGPIAESIVDTVREAGGLLSMEDLEKYDVDWTDPITSDYRSPFAFHEMPPNGQGIVALMALNIVRGFDLRAVGYGTADYWHLLIEATKLGFADASAYLADPRMASVPLDGLLSDAYADERRAMISLSEARVFGPGRPLSSGDTVYLTTADKYGNMVSWIQSLYMGFGSGITAGNSGIQLHNRGANFTLAEGHPNQDTLAEGHPNQVAPGKRPYHTIIPGFITKDGEPWCSFGVMGGFMQPQGHLQVGLNLVDFGMDPQSALDAPRFRWLRDRQVAFEPGIEENVLRDLEERGHHILASDRSAEISFGGGQVIVREPDTGLLIGGSEPRKDGAAVGY